MMPRAMSRPTKAQDNSIVNYSNPVERRRNHLSPMSGLTCDGVATSAERGMAQLEVGTWSPRGSFFFFLPSKPTVPK
jgi:hypothetical protein